MIFRFYKNLHCAAETLNDQEQKAPHTYSTVYAHMAISQDLSWVSLLYSSPPDKFKVRDANLLK